MTVTAVEEYTKGRYKIFLNDEFAFVLYKGELHKTGIALSAELDESKIEEINEGIVCKRAKLRAMNLLKSRDYTEKALRRKLKDGLYTDEIIEKAVSYVKSYGYIDDCRYAQNYIRSNIKQRSRKEIHMKLLEKGISPETIDYAFEEEYGMDTDEGEEELIKRLLMKKCRNTDASDPVGRKKILAYMYTKGFSTDKTERLLDEVLLDITS